jgi:nitrous oxide reductase accessory protein NosL
MKKSIMIVMFLVVSLFGGEIELLDNNASDPVYILPLNKYPQWICEAKLKNGKTVQFISVKSMMQVYQHPEYFQRHDLLDDKIETLYVQDFLNGRRVEADKAVYLFGSRMVGPHGDELIPFESEASAKLFMLKNGGTKILPFEKLTKGLIKYMDM